MDLTPYLVIKMEIIAEGYKEFVRLFTQAYQLPSLPHVSRFLHLEAIADISDRFHEEVEQREIIREASSTDNIFLTLKRIMQKKHDETARRLAKNKRKWLFQDWVNETLAVRFYDCRLVPENFDALTWYLGLSPELYLGFYKGIHLQYIHETLKFEMPRREGELHYRNFPIAFGDMPLNNQNSTIFLKPTQVQTNRVSSGNYHLQSPYMRRILVSEPFCDTTILGVDNRSIYVEGFILLMANNLWQEKAKEDLWVKNLMTHSPGTLAGLRYTDGQEIRLSQLILKDSP
jgi:hypothetical protein